MSSASSQGGAIVSVEGAVGLVGSPLGLLGAPFVNCWTFISPIPSDRKYSPAGGVTTTSSMINVRIGSAAVRKKTKRLRNNGYGAPTKVGCPIAPGDTFGETIGPTDASRAEGTPASGNIASLSPATPMAPHAENPNVPMTQSACRWKRFMVAVSPKSCAVDYVLGIEKPTSDRISTPGFAGTDSTDSKLDPCSPFETSAANLLFD